MRGNTAKIRPKSGQHHAIPSNYVIVRGLLPLYSHFSTLFPHSRPYRATSLDRQADGVRGARPGAGVGHARLGVRGVSMCVSALRRKSPCFLRRCWMKSDAMDWTHEMLLGEVKGAL